MKKLENAPILKTQLTTYRFDVSDREQAAAYEALCEELHAKGLTFFNVDPMSNGPYEWHSGEITLDCSYLFEDQWNTTDDSPHMPHYRVHEWYEPIYPNKRLKTGYYLTITPEMLDIQKNTVKCGYCGAIEPAALGHTFCPRCLGSAYLTEKDLFLTRMQPITKGNRGRAPLTEEERTHLLPLYVAAQTEGAATAAGQKLAKQRADLKKERDAAIYTANTKYSGFTWLMDHGFNIDNCIYYSHTDRFCFGWRTPLDAAVASALLDKISEFPFNYTLECADGRVLEN